MVALPVHFFLHVSYMAAAIVAQQEAAIVQTVDVYFDVRAIHNNDIRCWGLASHLQETAVIIYSLKKVKGWIKNKTKQERNKTDTFRQNLTPSYIRSTLTELSRLFAGSTWPLQMQQIMFIRVNCIKTREERCSETLTTSAYWPFQGM